MSSLMPAFAFSRWVVLATLAAVLVFFVLLVLRSRAGKHAVSRRDSHGAARTADIPSPDQAKREPEQNSIPDAPAKNSIEVVEADPLAEAAVYIEFGYFDRAAHSLRTYVDGAGGGNRDVLRKLLQLYLRLEQIDDYAEILDRLSDMGEAPEFIQTALLSGLEADHGNLQLRVLAESRLGLGPAQLSKLLGLEEVFVIDEDGPSDAEPLSGRDAAATVTAGPATGEKTERTRGNWPPESGDRPRLVLRLIEGGMRLTSSFSLEERAMLRVFTHPAHEARLHRAEARLHRGAGDLDAAVEALGRAIAARPQALVNFADLLAILHKLRKIEEYAASLWHLYLVLNGAGRALRERFLGMGFALGYHPVFEELAQATERNHIEAIGRKFGFAPAEQEPPRKLHLVEVTAPQRASAWPTEQVDILHEVNAYIEFGQIDQAIDALEAAIVADPGDARLYPPLLDLYDRMDELDRFIALSGRIKKLVQQPPEEIVPMMLSLQHRLQQRKQGSLRARENR